MWPRLAMLFLVALLASPVALLTPLPLKIAIDNVIDARPLPGPLDAVLPDALTGSSGALLVFVAALAVIIAVLSQAQSLAQKYLTTAAGEELVLRFRGQIFHHLQRLSLSYHDSAGSADSLYRMQHDAPALRAIVVDGFIPSVSAGVTLAGMVYVTAVIDWTLAVLALGVAPPLLLLARHYRPRLRRRSRKIKSLESQAMSVVHEVLGSLRVVKAFGQEDREGGRFVDRSQDGVRERMRLVLAEGGFKMLTGLAVAAGTAAVLFVGISHVQSGVLSLGSFTMVMGYVAKLYDPLKTISRKFATLQNHLASLERVFGVLDQHSDLTERADARPISRARGAVTFRRVSFEYEGDRFAVRDISFDIEPGTQLGIVGTTGAGKTTLVSLLTRLYDPTEGQILLDGVDLREYRIADLRRQFAIVLQEPVLFAASIAENIAYAVPDASREQIVAAAHAAGAHEFVIQLPEQYETHVGERGVKLSGGQRQRIALARAFLRNSPVLILDEPTSAVDRETEAAIVEALERVKRGRTVIIISHRPRTLAGCSAVLTLESGRVVADSTRRLADVPEQSAPSGHAVARTSASRSKRRETIQRHPAVQAWLSLDHGADRPVPERVAPATPKKPKRRKTAVYRLEGVGDGGVVIAKRCKKADAVIEHAVYEHYLSRLGLPVPGFKGRADDPDEHFAWLFMSEVSGEEYFSLVAEHRIAASGWLGRLHTGAEPLGPHADLPDCGPARYLAHLSDARGYISANFDNPVLTDEDLAYLDALLRRLDGLERRWDRVEEACALMPPTLVHGDFNGKNLRVQSGGSDPWIVAYDWEDAGWGVPAVDLAQAALPTSRITAGADIAAYWGVVRERWPNLTQADVERVAQCGTVFRALAALDWESHNLAHEWAQWFLRSFRLYDTELTHAIRRLDNGRASEARYEVAHP